MLTVPTGRWSWSMNDLINRVKMTRQSYRCMWGSEEASYQQSWVCERTHFLSHDFFFQSNTRVTHTWNEQMINELSSKSPCSKLVYKKKNDELTHLLTSEVRPKLFFPVLLRHVVNEVMLRIAFFPQKETWDTIISSLNAFALAMSNKTTIVGYLLHLK